MPTYFGQWIETIFSDGGVAYTAPHNGLGVDDNLPDYYSLDLRSDPQAGRSGQIGYGIFNYPTPMTHPALLFEFPRLDENLSTVNKQLITQRLGLGSSIASDSVMDIIQELYDDPTSGKYDPDGLLLHRPQTGKLILSESLVIRTNPSLDQRIAIFQSAYRRERQAGTTPLEKLRMFTANTMRKLFGTMNDSLAQQILPDPYKSDGWLRPSTTVGDDFTAGSDTALGSWTATGTNGGHTYTINQGGADVIASSDDCDNNTSSGHHRMRADADVGDDDMYCEITITLTDVSTTRLGPFARYASGADTCVFFGIRLGTTNFEGGRVVTGSKTVENSTALSASPASGSVMRLEVTGTGDAEAFDDAASIRTWTTTAPTGNQRGGFGGRASGATRWTLDDFEADSLASGPGNDEIAVASRVSALPTPIPPIQMIGR